MGQAISVPRPQGEGRFRAKACWGRTGRYSIRRIRRATNVQGASRAEKNMGQGRRLWSRRPAQMHSLAPQAVRRARLPLPSLPPVCGLRY